MNLTRSHSPPRPRRRVAGERAASLVEYCLVIALIAMMCIAAIGFFGSNQSGSLTNNANSIATAG